MKRMSRKRTEKLNRVIDREFTAMDEAIFYTILPILDKSIGKGISMFGYCYHDQHDFPISSELKEEIIHEQIE